MTPSPLLRVVFVLGGPGSGKGTQCARIAAHFRHCHLSAGELLRKEQEREDWQFGQVIRETIVRGKIVPSQITVGLLLRQMELERKRTQNFLIDGFPRNVENLESWVTAAKGIAESRLVLHLTCRE